MKCFICPFCGCELELKNKYTKSGHLAKCKKFKEYKENVLTKEYLKEEYIINERSAIELAQEHNLKSASVIINLLKYYGINTRSIKESKNEREKEKRTLTNLKRYGCIHNFCKEHPSRQEWERILFEKEGIINVFQRPDIIKLITQKKYESGLIIPRQYKTNLLEKYYSEVWYITNKNFNRFYYDINPEKLKRGITDYHLDHKISITFGFINNIDPEIIGHRCNLQMLYYKDNLNKWSRCDITLKELLERIKDFERIENQEN